MMTSRMMLGSRNFSKNVIFTGFIVTDHILNQVVKVDVGGTAT